MTTGYLPIGSCSRRVPQAGAAVPRTGNVPGADLEALPSKDTARRGGGQTNTGRSKTQAQSADPAEERHRSLSAGVTPGTRSQEMAPKAGNACSVLVHRLASWPTPELFITLQARLLNWVTT
ncbi:unnamed protein product [Rangifer tarandus platyrhynchus]|uniref:Uncharacterized protein n=2 Tax=Rangifer tarandus platyrhynchus TaxID=3082113 RepID=A0ABN8XYP1_RANTA|nr:unnamed protein product [Rangifer tarandus platyrhynchus]